MDMTSITTANSALTSDGAGETVERSPHTEETAFMSLSDAIATFSKNRGGVISDPQRSMSGLYSTYVQAYQEYKDSREGLTDEASDARTNAFCEERSAIFERMIAARASSLLHIEEKLDLLLKRQQEQGFFDRNEHADDAQDLAVIVSVRDDIAALREASQERPAGQITIICEQLKAISKQYIAADKAKDNATAGNLSDLSRSLEIQLLMLPPKSAVEAAAQISLAQHVIKSDMPEEISGHCLKVPVSLAHEATIRAARFLADNNEDIIPEYFFGPNNEVSNGFAVAAMLTAGLAKLERAHVGTAPIAKAPGKKCTKAARKPAVKSRRAVAQPQQIAA